MFNLFPGTMLVLLLVASAWAAPAVKNDAVARFEATLGGAEALERHRNMLRTVIGDSEPITEPRKGVWTSQTGRRPSENEINEPISEFLYQGDILLTADDVARMTATRSKRGAPAVTTKRFNKNQPIGFIFDSAQPESARKIIRETIAKVAANTCLSFKENSGVMPQLLFYRGGGCFSVVGQQADPRFGGNQQISIDQGCVYETTITHEIFHVLGIDHTHTRKDRDSFVTVLKDNIITGKDGNFKKYSDAENNNFGVPYEYGSIMHYYPTDYSYVVGKPAMELKYPDYNNTVAQRQLVTYNDYRLVNALYNCSSHCPKQMVCQNGGYPSPKDCNACVCPEFYSGTNCQTPKNLITLSASTPSGKSVFHTDQNNAIVGRTEKELYGRDAPRVIKAPEGRRIRVTFTQISVNNGKFKSCPSMACDVVGIDIVDAPGGDLTSLGKRFCCPANFEGYSFVSQSNVVGYKAYINPGMNVDITVSYTLV